MTRKILIIALYWTLAVFLIAGVLSSLEYSFPEAVLLGCLFPPGALALKFLFSKIRMEEKAESRTKNMIFVSFAVLAFEYAQILLALSVIFSTRGSELLDADIPSIMLNPLFILLLLGIMLAGDYFLELYINSKVHVEEQPLSFFSNRKKESVLPSEILYVESNDTEVWIHTSDGRKYRNKTPISRWQDILGESFVRVHRSYLVRRDRIKDASSTQVTIEETAIPVSKKYADLVLNILKNQGE